MQISASSSLVLLLLLPLMAWRIHARVRKLVTRQRLSSLRSWIALAVFPALIVLFAWLAGFELQRCAWLGAGVIAGILLAVYGLRTTHFESTPQGLFYTPNAYLGFGLALLVIGRILYRLIQLYTGGLVAHGAAGFAQSPFTLTVFGLLAGYYTAYTAGLLRWQNRRAATEV